MASLYLHLFVQVKVRRIIELNTPVHAFEHAVLEVEERDLGLEYTVNTLDTAQSQMSLFSNHKIALCATRRSHGSVFIALLAVRRCLETHRVDAAFGLGNWNGWVDKNGPDDAGKDMFPPTRSNGADANVIKLPVRVSPFSPEVNDVPRAELSVEHGLVFEYTLISCI